MRQVSLGDGQLLTSSEYKPTLLVQNWLTIHEKKEKKNNNHCMFHYTHIFLNTKTFSEISSFIVNQKHRNSAEEGVSYVILDFLL